MKVWLLGVRGSTPSPGPDFVSVGGNTSCVAIAADDGPPTLVLDAGTGLRRLTGLLDGRPFRGTIALTHLHWDHTQGLPFFAAGDRPDAEVRLLLPAQDDPVEILSRALSPPHFPIGPEGLRGSWCFEGLEVGTSTLEGLVVTAAEVAHKGGRTYGYRIDDGHASIAYVPDHLLIGELANDLRPGSPAANALALCQGVDVLIHDAQFTEGERRVAQDYGHATIEAAVALAVRAGVGRLVLFHHGPDRTDHEVATLAAEAQARAVALASDLVVEAGGEDRVLVVTSSRGCKESSVREAPLDR